MAGTEFTPKLLSLLREGISGTQLRRDMLSGLIVGVVALPLAIAFAIASGVAPEKGLVTAVVAGLAISAFGGSRVQIGGPTGAFIVIVYGIVEKHGVEGLTIATLMAGVLILLMGLLRLGKLLKYFPYTLIVGFTAGIAVIIFSAQVKDLLGLEMGAVPSGFVEKWAAYGAHLTSISPYAVAIGLGSVAVTFGFTRILPAVPGALVAIVLATLAAELFHLPVETIASRFGAIPSTFPAPTFPRVDMATLRGLLGPAVAIALLGSIESLLSAVVADGMIGGRHRSNMELVAQGGANILSGLFGGIPATGAIARTATNVKNGGRTPIAGVVHAFTLLVIMLVAAPLAGKIPLACLAGILVVVAYNMGEWHNFVSVLKGDKHDVAVLLATFFITVVFDLVLAIQVGMVLAAFLFMKRMGEATDLKPLLAGGEGEDGPLLDQELRDLPREVLVFEINGPLFFGAAQKFQDVMARLNDRHEVVVFRMRNVPMIDATGLHRLGDIVQGMTKRGVRVHLAEVDPRVRGAIEAQPWSTPALFLRTISGLKGESDLRPPA